MAWQLSGQLIETCSCNMFCPCWYGVKELMLMDQGWCRSALAFQIQRGTSDGVDLSGRAVAFGVNFPGPTLFDGNGTGRIYVDQGASAEQYRALDAIFAGKRGGPMAVLGGLVTTWLPTQSARIDVEEAGDTVRVTVGNVGEVHSQLLRDQTGATFTLQGGGFVAGLGMQAATLAPSSSRWSDPDLPTFETKSGARGAFTWSG